LIESKLGNQSVFFETKELIESGTAIYLEILEN